MTAAELRALHGAATPGPWIFDSEWIDEDGGTHYLSTIIDDDERSVFQILPGGSIEPNAILIVALRNAVPELIEALEDRDRIDYLQESGNYPIDVPMLDDLRAAIDAARKP